MVEIIAGIVVFIVVALTAGVVLFKVARRTMKFVVRVAIFCVIVVALAVGGMVWWSTRSGEVKGSGKPNRPANSRRR